jgi:hypothetical protein
MKSGWNKKSERFSSSHIWRLLADGATVLYKFNFAQSVTSSFLKEGHARI